jgi:hypothetical protein
VPTHCGAQCHAGAARLAPAQADEVEVLAGIELGDPSPDQCSARWKPRAGGFA